MIDLVILILATLSLTSTILHERGLFAIFNFLRTTWDADQSDNTSSQRLVYWLTPNFLAREINAIFACRLCLSFYTGMALAGLWYSSNYLTNAYLDAFAYIFVVGMAIRGGYLILEDLLGSSLFGGTRALGLHLIGMPRPQQPAQGNLQALQTKLGELEKRLDELEKIQGSSSPTKKAVYKK